MGWCDIVEGVQRHEPMNTTNTNLLTLREAVQRLRISPRSYYRLVQRKALPAPVKIGSKTLVLEADIVRYVEALVAARDAR